MSSEKTLVLVNPGAQEGALGAEWLARERELLDALGDHQAQVVFTTLEDRGEKLVRGALKRGVKRVVVVGGDGTVSEAAQGFFEGDEPVFPGALLCIVPAGRGNDWIRSLIPASYRKGMTPWQLGISLLREGLPKPTDIGKIEFFTEAGKAQSRIFVNLASFGFPGLVVKRVIAADKTSAISRSRWVYLRESLLALGRYEPLEFLVKIDGQMAYEGPIFSGFALNGAYNAGGLCWSADARVDDGLLHALVLEPSGLLTSALNFRNALSGRWKGVRGTCTGLGKTMEARLTGKRPPHPIFEVDGEQPEPDGTVGARFTLLDQKLLVQRVREQ